jgi:hypothetical protein
MDLQQLCIALLGQAVKTHLEPKCNNLPLWDNGLGRLAEGLVQSAGIPALTGDDVAVGTLRALGMGPNPRRGGIYRPIRRAPAESQNGAVSQSRVIDVQAEVVS